MKHIGKCLEKIQILLAGIPRNIDSKEDEARAIEIIDEIEEYAITLKQLVMNPKLRGYLHRLEAARIYWHNREKIDPYLSKIKEAPADGAITPLGGVIIHAHGVEELLKDLEHMVYLLELYIKNLKTIIGNHSGTWASKGKQFLIAMAYMLDSRKAKLSKEYSIAQRFKALVRKQLNQWSDKADQLALAIDQKFGGENGELREEFQIALYNVEELKQIVKNEKHLAEFLR